MKWLLCMVSLACLSLCYQGWSMISPQDYAHVIHVDPRNPISRDNSSCYPSQSSDSPFPCADINFALAFPGKTQSTKFNLSVDAVHHLKNNITTTVFDGALSVAFSGDNGTAVVECMAGAGLAFLNSTNITFNGVSFQKCGAWRDSTSRDFSSNSFQLMQIRVALYFYNCRDVTMVNMSVLNSTKAVGVVMYSTAGVNYIAHSQFDGNNVSKSNKNESGGGGFAVEFNYCKPGDNSCNETNYQTENNHNAVYIFEHCSFSNNRAIDHSGKSKTGVSILPINQTHSSLGRGGGLSVYFKAAAFNNHVRIHNCTFHRNHANWGGGLCVQYADHSIQNQVLVTESSFITNHCYFRHEPSGTVGGGVLVSSPVHYDFKRNNTILRNNITFEECIFTNNRAITGGALAFVYTLQRLSENSQLFHATISNSIFSSNLARLGSAVAVDHEYFYHEGELGDMLLVDCTFFNNTIVYNDTTKPYSVGVGALYISEVHVTFQGLMEFRNNTGSALTLVGTRITFDASSDIVFTTNRGAKGGAIALLGGASMVIGEGMQMVFEENSAIQFGGAIYNTYVGKEDLRSSVKCFMQYNDSFKEPKDWNARFEFRGNTAGHLGNSIFSSTILPCSWSEDLQAGPDVINEIFCWNASNWIYENSNCSNEINTFPRNFTTQHNLTGYPGNPFQLNITARDDLGHDVTTYTIYSALITNTAAKVDRKYTYIANGSVRITGKEGLNVTLQLDVAEHRDWRIKIPIYLKKCPLGFIANTTGSRDSETAQTSCECIGGDDAAISFGGKLTCDEAAMVSKIQNGYWFGKVPGLFNDAYVMGSTKLLLRNTKQNYLNLTDSQCSHLNRKGPLCGECIDGYSTAVNSYNYKCVPCTSNTTNLAANIAAYIGLTYVPYLIAFIAIIYFDVRLMSGPLVGFILYAQLIGSGVVDLTIGRLPYSSSDSKIPLIMQKAYRLAYGVFNLNSFSKVMDPFCVNEYFTTLDVICLDLAEASFPLILIFVLYVFIRLSARCRPQLTTKKGGGEASSSKEGKKRNLIHSFVGFVYLSYIKFSVASTLLLTQTSVITQGGSAISSPKLIYYAGQYTFSDMRYFIPYGLIGIVVLTFCIGLPLLLVGLLDVVNWCLDEDNAHRICRSKTEDLERSENCLCGCMRRAWPSAPINTFLQACRNCYRPNRRYFAGLYFLFRLIILIIFAFSPSPLIQVLWQLWWIMIMILLVLVFQPHESKLCNYIDVLMLFNLAGVAIISVYLYTSPSQLIDGTYPVEVYTGGLVVLWLPTSYFLLYILRYFVKKCSCYRNLEQRMTPHFQKVSAYFSDDIGPAEVQARTVDGYEQLIDRAEEQVRAADVRSAVVEVHGLAGVADVSPVNNE